MLEVIRQDYISTARAKGDDERTITFQHMLKNALIPIITAVGLQFGNHNLAFYFYILNITMVSIDICLYFRNLRLEKQIS